MKKLLLLAFVSVTMMAAVSCSKDDDAPYPALITFNVFQDDAALVGIEPLQ